MVSEWPRGVEVSLGLGPPPGLATTAIGTGSLTEAGVQPGHEIPASHLLAGKDPCLWRKSHFECDVAVVGLRQRFLRASRLPVGMRRPLLTPGCLGQRMLSMAQNALCVAGKKQIATTVRTSLADRKSMRDHRARRQRSPPVRYQTMRLLGEHCCWCVRQSAWLSYRPRATDQALRIEQPMAA